MGVSSMFSDEEDIFSLRKALEEFEPVETSRDSIRFPQSVIEVIELIQKSRIDFLKLITNVFYRDKIFSLFKSGDDVLYFAQMMDTQIIESLLRGYDEQIKSLLSEKDLVTKFCDLIKEKMGKSSLLDHFILTDTHCVILRRLYNKAIKMQSPSAAECEIYFSPPAIEQTADEKTLLIDVQMSEENTSNRAQERSNEETKTVDCRCRL